MKKLLFTLIIPLLVSVILLPHPARAVEDDSVWAQSTYIAQNFLTRPIYASDTLKWTVKTIFAERAVARNVFTVKGTTLFQNAVEITKRLTANHLEVPGDAYFGQTRFDNFLVENKIRRSGGPIIIDDGLRINRKLDLRTATIESAEIENGTITDLDLAKDYQEDYVEVISVSPVGTATQNGNVLRTTLDGIMDNSSSKPYVLRLEPGTYDLGSATLDMKPYVDVEGSGMDATVVAGQLGSGVVIGEANSGMRSLTLEVDTTGVGAVGVALSSGDDFSMRDMHIDIKNAQDASVGVQSDGASPSFHNVKMTVDGTNGSGAIGINNLSGAITVTDVEINVLGAATSNLAITTNGDVTVINSELNADGGQNSTGVSAGTANVSILDSVITGTGGATTAYAVRSNGTIKVDRSDLMGDDGPILSDGTVYVGQTKLDGTVSGSGSYRCANSYNGSYGLVNNSCL